MEQLVEEAMRQGAMGVSTSLIYAPAFYAKTEELIALATSANELGDAISLALSENSDSPKKAKRIAIARQHSIENLSAMLHAMIGQQAGVLRC